MYLGPIPTAFPADAGKDERRVGFSPATWGIRVGNPAAAAMPPPHVRKCVCRGASAPCHFLKEQILWCHHGVSLQVGLHLQACLHGSDLDALHYRSSHATLYPLGEELTRGFLITSVNVENPSWSNSVVRRRMRAYEHSESAACDAARVPSARVLGVASLRTLLRSRHGKIPRRQRVQSRFETGVVEAYCGSVGQERHVGTEVQGVHHSAQLPPQCSEALRHIAYAAQHRLHIQRQGRDTLSLWSNRVV